MRIHKRPQHDGVKRERTDGKGGHSRDLFTFGEA